MAGSINRRRKFLIDGSQRQLLGVYFVHFMVVLVVFFAAMIFIFNQQVISSEGLTVDQKQEFASLMSSFVNKMWPTMWVLFLFMILHAIYVSHKIAGPLFNIRTVMSYVGTGNLTARVKLRKGDFLTQDADTVNDTIGELDRRLSDMFENCKAADKALDGLNESIESGSRTAARKCSEELRSALDDFKETLGVFQLSGPRPAPPQYCSPPVKKTPEPVA
jgi:methyl-accepting chemotaxis protein